ncbi:ATP-binding protein [Bacillus sp. WLY-B-L8]|uniref:ATP-binding protein n=1 Tax=Bacillus multifaciens TaxID=3068506 RepID=UPI0027405573|nr:ATP-binding protein [Bacillus sp. WLY-B-L8]MDP7981248.1 ATP-binding protein [Bacillus sp. WLY-B-L8]
MENHREMEEKYSLQVNENRWYEAVYIEQKIEEYRGNPFLETLPPVMDSKLLTKGLLHYPAYSDEERKELRHYRIHYLRRLNKFFQPFFRHSKLYEMFDCALRQSYLQRNPLDIKEKVHLNNIYNSMLNGEFIDCSEASTTSEGFLIIGISGGGKSRSINRLLAMYPQVIQHKEYKTQFFVRTQVVYLKIDCPHDGTLKGLAAAFFSELDRILGTNYATTKMKGGRANVTQLMLAMENLIVIHAIGILIVDEIQHLSIAKSQGEEMMMNFFVTLTNRCKIPIIFVGTPKTESLFGKALRQTRRMCGQGYLVWENLKKDDSEWNLFVKMIWGYQWTKEKTPLTDELREAFYESCQGIIAVAIKSYILTQMETMKKKKEVITPKMFQEASKKHLRILKPMLSAIKSGNRAEMKKYEDILITFINEEVEGIIDNEIEAFNLEYHLEQQQEQMQSKDNKEELELRLLDKIQSIGFSYKDAKEAIINVLQVYEKNKSEEFLAQQAIQYIIMKNKPNTDELTVEQETTNLMVKELEKATRPAKKKSPAKRKAKVTDYSKDRTYIVNVQEDIISSD